MKIQKVVIPALIIIGFLIFFGAISTLTNKNSKETKGETTSSSTQRSESIVRQPYAAGSFYPADSQELAARLNAFLSGVDKIEASGKLRILIVPHAGIDYSGNVAAGGFKQLEGQSYRRVILLGVSHNVYFDHIAVYPSGEWETPLGKVAVDEDLAQTLTDEPQMIKSNRQAHEQEHSLEVELIFLQQVLSDFKIVPVLIGQVADETLSSLARKVSNNLSDQTLLVVSTDLSHYPSKKVADEVDRETIEAILSGNSDIFTQSIKKNESADYPNLVTCACGAQAVRVALQSAKLLNLTDFKKIAYENSGDVTGDNERAVGYAAIGVWGKTENSGEVMLDNESQKEALAIARETLVEYISHQKIPSVIATSAVLQDNLGAFVTLRKDGQLRGCLGRFEPDEPLRQVIQMMTIAAATDDPRFSPIQPVELAEIKIEISVMTPKRKIEDWQEIELGKEGVVVQKGMYSGTFLPQVATETGWSKEEFLRQLCTQKAGLPENCYQDPEVDLYVFEAQVLAEE